MKSTNSYPADLAQAISKELEQRNANNPSLDILVNLFETLYFSSFETEELHPITCYIVYLPPDNPDPKPPKRIVNNRWSYIRLSSSIPLTVSNLVKLAQASDPRTSSFAVYHDANDGHLFIWGIIDQANEYHDWMNYDSDEGMERPGIFQVNILGVAHLIAYIGFEKIAELKSNTLLGKTLDVLTRGPVNEVLMLGVNEYIKSIRSIISEDIYEERLHWDSSLAWDWISSLCRLLLRTQNYGHGGALLITPDTSLKGLNVKYSIQYSRLYSALKSVAVTRIQETFASDQIFEHYLEQEDEWIPVDLYLEETVNNSELESSQKELNGAIWFISLLTRVDGLVLMTPNLEVQGFGVEITYNEAPEKVFLAIYEHVTKRSLKELDYKHFGTRHRSMMRYCSHIPGSVGFVISQDDDVRVMTQVHERLIIWENIKLQRTSTKKKRARKRLAINRPLSTT